MATSRALFEYVVEWMVESREYFGVSKQAKLIFIILIKDRILVNHLFSAFQSKFF